MEMSKIWQDKNYDTPKKCYQTHYHFLESI